MPRGRPLGSKGKKSKDKAKKEPQPQDETAKTPSSANSKPIKITNSAKAKQIIPLADRPGPLRREDVKCCICLSILMEPVTFPCEHALCLICFNKHLIETSLQCPYCRMRVGTWARRAFKQNNLVNVKLWDRIKREFPKLVQTRQLGEDSQQLSAEDCISVLDQNNVPENQASASSTGGGGTKNEGGDVYEIDEDEEDDEFLMPPRPPRDGEDNSNRKKGELKEELEAINRRHEEDIEKRRKAEEDESQSLIRQLQEQAEQERLQNCQQTEAASVADRELALKLSEQEKQEQSAGINGRRKLFSLPSPAAAAASATAGTTTSSRPILLTGAQLRHSLVHGFGASPIWSTSETPRKRPAPSPSSSSSAASCSGAYKRQKSSLNNSFASWNRPGGGSGSKSAMSLSAGSQNSQNSILNYLSQTPNSSTTQNHKDISAILNSSKTTPPTATVTSGQFLGYYTPQQSHGNLQNLQRKSAFSSTIGPSALVSFSLAVGSGRVSSGGGGETSAFSAISNSKSATKSSSSIVTAVAGTSQTTSYQQSVLKPINNPRASSSSALSLNNEERDVPSPNSIDMEVNSHFRPIRSEPKTPPRRRSDGTFDTSSMEVVKSTPVKVKVVGRPCMPPNCQISPTSGVEVILVDSQSTVSDNEDSSEADDNDFATTDVDCSGISCVPLSRLQEQDSSQDSSLVEEEDPLFITKKDMMNLKSPVKDNNNKEPLFKTPTPKKKVVVLEDLCLTQESQYPDSEPLPEGVEEEDEEEDSGDNPPQASTSGLNVVATGPSSPTDSDLSLNWLFNNEQEAVASSSSKSSQQQNQNMESQPVDLDLVAEQAAVLQAILDRVRQEEEDRKLAQKLSKELNRAPPVQRGEDNPYSLRSWLSNEKKKKGGKNKGKSGASSPAGSGSSSGSRPNTRGSTRSTAPATVTSGSATNQEIATSTSASTSDAANENQ